MQQKGPSQSYIWSIGTQFANKDTRGKARKLSERKLLKHKEATADTDDAVEQSMGDAVEPMLVQGSQWFVQLELQLEARDSSVQTATWEKALIQTTTLTRRTKETTSSSCW